MAYEKIIKPKISDRDIFYEKLTNEYNELDDLRDRIYIKDKIINMFKVSGLKKDRLLKYIDLSLFNLPEDLPSQAYIITGAKEESYVIEEFNLLDIAVNNLFKVESYYQLFYQNYLFWYYFPERKNIRVSLT